MKVLLLSAGLFLSLHLSSAQEAAPAADTAAKPAEAYLLGTLSTIRATVEKVDPETRLVTLKSDKGVTREVVAGPAVVNFAQIKVGDQVTFKVQESLSYQILKKGTPSGAVSGKATTSTHAAEGSKPAGEISETASIVTLVAARDLAAGSVTLKFPDNSFRVFTVKDPIQLEGVQVGDQVLVKASRKIAAVVTTPVP